MVTFPRMVTMQLQPVLPYMNLASKNSYWDKQLALKCHSTLLRRSLRWMGSTKATHSAGQKKATLNFANISATEDWICLKFETWTHKWVMDHHKNVGKDPCTYMRTQCKNVHACTSKRANLHLCLYLRNRRRYLYKNLRLKLITD